MEALARDLGARSRRQEPPLSGHLGPAQPSVLSPSAGPTAAASPSQSQPGPRPSSRSGSWHRARAAGLLRRTAAGGGDWAVVEPLALGRWCWVLGCLEMASVPRFRVQTWDRVLHGFLPPLSSLSGAPGCGQAPQLPGGCRFHLGTRVSFPGLPGCPRPRAVPTDRRNGSCENPAKSLGGPPRWGPQELKQSSGVCFRWNQHVAQVSVAGQWAAETRTSFLSQELHAGATGSLLGLGVLTAPPVGRVMGRPLLRTQLLTCPTDLVGCGC